MGNTHSLTHKPPPPENLPTKPSGLYAHDPWNPLTIRRKILHHRLAPRYSGSETLTTQTPETCPICLQHYPSLNHTKCCDQGICTECWLQVRPPRRRSHMKEEYIGERFGWLRGLRGRDGGGGCDCPFCKVGGVGVVYRGVKSGVIVEMEMGERKRVEGMLEGRRIMGRGSTAGEDGVWKSGKVREGRRKRERGSGGGGGERRERDGRGSVRRFVVPEPVQRGEFGRRRGGVESYADFRTLEWVRDLQERLEVVERERNSQGVSMPDLGEERRVRTGRSDGEDGESGDGNRNGRQNHRVTNSQGGRRRNRRMGEGSRGNANRIERGNTRGSVDSDTNAIEAQMLKTALRQSLLVK